MDRSRICLCGEGSDRHRRLQIGWGNPDRLRDTDPAVATAPAVLSVLMAGAHLVGKTHTDEMACGMFGINPHFGTPINPKAPSRVPGGSSSGSASGGRGGLCDFALGTDTGGSSAFPQAFAGFTACELRLAACRVAGIMAMAPSFDTVGWFARDAGTLRRVGEIYFGPIGELGETRLLLARDAFNIPVRSIGEALLPAARSLGACKTRSRYLSKASISGSTRSGRCNCTICGRHWAPGARLQGGSSARRSRERIELS